MKFSTIFFLGLLISIGLIGGCSNQKTSTNGEFPTSLVSSTPLTTPVSTSTLELPKQNSLPSSTLTPIPFFTLTPTSLPTQTISPTLSTDEARSRLLDLLANNGNCRLPCLWGITPGKSTYQEAKSVLTPLNSISGFGTGFGPGNGSSGLNYYVGDFDLRIDIGFLTDKNDLVTSVRFIGEAFKKLKDQPGTEKVYDWEFFTEQVSQYNLTHILSEYGRPSSVLLSTLTKPSDLSGLKFFNILLLYPDQGILVSYKTELRVAGEYIMGCPAGAHIELDLHPSGQGQSFLDLLSTDWQETIRVDYQPLEKVTSMSLDMFYQTFRHETDQCLFTPAKFWPLPER